jgi:aspartate kinase
LALKELFKVKYNSELTLITLRHYTNASVDELTAGKTVFMKQTKQEYCAGCVKVIN